MLRVFPAPLDHRIIDAGRVSCPVRGSDIDLDRCLSCRWLSGIHDASPTPSIRCRPDYVSPRFLQLPL